MSLSTAATVLLVPPMNLACLAALGVALAGRWRRLGHTLAAIGLAGVLLLGLPVVADLLIASLEQGLPLTPPAADSPGAIVILGGDEARGSGGAAENVDLGGLSLERVRAGATLYRRTGLPVLVSGGILRQGSPPIATLMARSLTDDFAVPVRWQETESATTWENAGRSVAILRQAGIHSVWLVTQAWHERRALLAFHRFGLVATAFPTRLAPLPGIAADDFVPAVSALGRSYYALHEWIGCAWYALRRDGPREA
jgi:uncharacterized SAM-binding protein YcdF (DUF218 family)